MDEALHRKRRAWTVMFLTFFAGIAMAWAQNKIPPVIGVLMEDLSISMAAAGWLSSIFCVTGILMALPAAAMIKRIGLRRGGVVALDTAILGTVVGLLAPGAVVLFLSRLLEGVGVGLIGVICPSIVAMWFPSESRGLPMGIWGSWQMAAQALTFFLAGGLVTFTDWKGMWWFGLVILAIALVLYAWKVSSPPPGSNYAGAEDDSGQAAKITEVFKSKSVWLVFALSTLFCVACFGWCTWAALYLNEELGMDVEWANTIIGIVYMIEIGAAIVEGWLLDRVKSRKRFGMIAGMLYALILFVSFRLPSAAWVLPFVILYPFLEGVVVAVSFTIAPQAVKNPAHTGGALALLVMGNNIGMVAGPPLTGFFIERHGWQVATIPMAIAALVTGLIFAVVRLYNDKGEGIQG